MKGHEISDEARPAGEATQSRPVDPWFGALTRLSCVGVIVVDKSGGVRYASDKARELLECDRTEELDECLAPVREELCQLAERAGRDPQAAMAGAVKQTIQLAQPERGWPRRFALELYPITDPCDSGGAYLITLRDRSAEEQVEQDMHLAAQFRNLGHLYQAMAHDLRTPVATVTLYSQLLRQDLEADQPPPPRQARRREYLDVMLASIQLLDRSLQGLLEEIAPRPQERQVFDLRQILDDTAPLVRAQARRQHIALQVRLPDQPVPVLGRQLPLRHAVLNLAVNALEAMPEGGDLELSIAVDHQATQVRLAVTDTGPGISEQAQTHMFDRQYTTKPSGTGLGLSVAHQAVEAEGGRLSYRTQAGQGTRFEIALPLAEQA